MIDDIIKIQNEFSCLELPLRTGHVSTLRGRHETPRVQFRSPQARSLHTLGTVRLPASHWDVLVFRDDGVALWPAPACSSASFRYSAPRGLSPLFRTQTS